MSQPSTPLAQPAPARTVPNSPRYTPRVLRGSASIIDGIEQAWNDLCQSEPNDVPFYTPEWIRKWLTAFAPDATLTIFLVMEGSIVRGIAPFIEHVYGTGPLRWTRLSAPANVYSGRADIVLAPMDRDALAAILWTAIRRESWTVLDWRLAPEGGCFDVLIRHAEADGYPIICRKTHDSPYLAYEPGTDVSRMGPASQFRRHKRKLEQLDGYELRECSPATAESFDAFLTIESTSWKGKEGTDVQSDPAAKRFFSTVMTTPGTAYAPVTHELRVNGVTVAVDVGINMAYRYYSMKHSFDTGYSKFGVGHVKVHEMITRQAAAGFREFDFLGAAEEYKLRWTETTRALRHYLVFRPTLLGRVLQPATVRGIPLVKQIRQSVRSGQARQVLTRLAGRFHRG